MKHFFVFLFLIFNFLFLISFSQVWYFGNGAGIKFSGGNVIPLSDGKIFTNEGCSAGYNANGELLFYSDGITVWDRNHYVFKNGEGLNGNHSATQSALAVPYPGDENLYYLFTADTLAGGKGICYSVIDISKKLIVKKNQKLLYPATEKLAAVHSSDGKKNWVITHQWNSNNFYAFPVTAKGIEQPVISSVGSIHKETGSGKNWENIGEIKFSPDGNKLAAAVCYRATDNLEIFDFDKNTGKIYNPLSLSVYTFPYGICFSLDNSKLYISCLKGTNGIVQYDLISKQFTGIAVNEKQNSFGSLQMSTDNKIYVARISNFLDVIPYPDKAGISCGYVNNAVNLSPAGCAFGLPNFILPSKEELKSSISSFDCSKIIETPFSKKESGTTAEIVVCDLEYILNAKNFGSSFSWSTHETTQKIRADTTGIYKISITKNGCTLIDSVRLRFRKDMAVFRYLPSFNPESEFLNSEFYYSIEEIFDFDLKVFDNKMKLIFETKNPEQKWNGKNSKGEFVSAGEYNWEAKFRPQCPKDAKEVTRQGKVIVKRNKK